MTRWSNTRIPGLCLMGQAHRMWPPAQVNTYSTKSNDVRDTNFGCGKECVPLQNKVTFNAKGFRCKQCGLLYRTEEEARNNHTYFQTHFFEPQGGCYPAQSTKIPVCEASSAPNQISDVTVPAEEGISGPARSVPVALAAPPTRAKTVMCSICNLGVESERALRLHVRNSHQQPPASQNCAPSKMTSPHQLYCLGCNAEIKISDIQKHEQSTGHFWNCRRKGIFCDACHQPFFTRADLNLHKRKDVCHLTSGISTAYVAQRGPTPAGPTMLTTVTIPSSTHCFACRVEVYPTMLQEHIAQPSHIRQCKIQGLYCDLCDCSFFTTGERFRHDHDNEDSTVRPVTTASALTSTTQSQPSDSFTNLVRPALTPVMAVICDVCNLSFENEQARRQHVSNSDAHRCRFFCNYCGMGFLHEREWTNHCRGKLPCPSRPRYLLSVSRGVDPTGSSAPKPAPKPTGSIRCELCNLDFKNYQDRHTHVKVSELHRQVFGCQNCNRGCLNQAGLLIHFELKHGFSPPPCQNRAKCLKASATPIQHVYCVKCKMFFHGAHDDSTCHPISIHQKPAVQTLPKHKRVNYCEACRVSVFPSMIEEHANSPFHVRQCKVAGLYCGACHRSLFSNTDMQSHFAGCIQGMKEQIHQQEPPLDCEVCDDKVDIQYIPQQGRDESHITARQDEGPNISSRESPQQFFPSWGSGLHKNKCLEFRCRDCDIQLPTAKRLNKHLKICQSVPGGTFSCEPCNKKFSERCHLIIHLSNHKPVKCKCLKTFRRFADKINHLESGVCVSKLNMQAIDSLIKLHKSSECPRKYRYFTDVIRHLESDACVSGLGKQAINSLIKLHDTTKIATINDTLQLADIPSGIDETKFLTPDTTVVEETGNDNDDEGGVHIFYTPPSTSPCHNTTPTPTSVPTPLGKFAPTSRFSIAIFCLPSGHLTQIQPLQRDWTSIRTLFFNSPTRAPAPSA